MEATTLEICEAIRDHEVAIAELKRELFNRTGKPYDEFVAGMRKLLDPASGALSISVVTTDEDGTVTRSPAPGLEPYHRELELERDVDESDEAERGRHIKALLGEAVPDGTYGGARPVCLCGVGNVGWMNHGIDCPVRKTARHRESIA